jgi:hypothetical protein
MYTSRTMIAAATLLVAVAGASLGGTAAASEPSFSYGEIGVLKSSGGVGGSLHASGTIGSTVLMHGGADLYDYRDGTIFAASLGLGLHFAVAPSVQTAFVLSAELAGGSYKGGGMDDEGIDGAAAGGGAGVEFRARSSDRMEMRVAVRYVNLPVGNGPGRVLGSAGIRFYASPQLAAGLDVNRNYFGTQLALVFRLDFHGR